MILVILPGDNLRSGIFRNGNIYSNNLTKSASTIHRIDLWKIDASR